MKKFNLNSINFNSPARKTALIIAVGALLNAALLYFGILPTRSRVTEIQKTIQETTRNIDHTKEIVQTIPSTKERIAALRVEYDELTEKGVLTPLLNSHAMRAKTLVAPLAAKASLKIERVDKLPRIPLRRRIPLKREIFSRQPVRFSTSGSYTQITAFISYVEKELPMAVLSSLKILSQPRSPENHKVSVSFEWPVKNEISSQK